MNKMIPLKVVREIIADVLIKRSNKIEQACNEMQEKELDEIGVVLDYSASVGWEACGIRVLADDILAGEISIKEAIKEILDKDEIDEVKNRCENWIKETSKIERER